MIGLRRGWGALLYHELDDPASASEWFQQLTPSGRPDDRPHGARSSLRPARTQAASGRAMSPPPRRPCRRRRAVRLHRSRAPRRRVARHRRPHPDRRRRHPLLRPPDARGGRAGDRHPEDDGQRRPRDGLLHRLLDRGDTRRAVHPQPPHLDRVARANRRHRALRPLQRRDVPHLRTSRASTAP